MPDRVIVHRETIQTNNGAVDVEVIIKASAIARALGNKAIKQKSKKSRIAWGLVECRAPKK